MSDGIDDYLKDLGFDDTPRSREEQLYGILTAGHYKKIDNCRYWLTHEMAKYQFILNRNIKITKDVFSEKNVTARPISKLDYAKIHLEYYLQMYHLPYFIKLDDGKEPANMAKIIDLIVAYLPIKEVIEKNYT